WMHKLVAIRRRTDHSIAQGSDDALHLPGIGGHQGGCASRLGSPTAFVQRPLLERRLPEADRRSEILVERIPRTAPRAIPQGAGRGPRPPGDVLAVGFLNSPCSS